MEISNVDQTDTTLTNYLTRAENRFVFLLHEPDLDRRLSDHPSLAHEFEDALDFAVEAAFTNDSAPETVHLFLQRVLYRINRLKLFWYDDLSHYDNERSGYLRMIRNRIESAWQPWELSQLAWDGINSSAAHSAVTRSVNGRRGEGARLPEVWRRTGPPRTVPR